MLKNATVLITGGTGSFGEAMVHRLLEANCREIRILSRDETKQDAMRNSLRAASVPIRFMIGDVRDEESLSAAVRGVDLVFHAAALKQVPSCEFFPIEAVRTNVIGSSNVIRSAVRAGVQSVVCLSTDKSVEPVNAMGMTKGLMEKVVAAEARLNNDSDTTICCVRYGNVLFSRGSVVPLFLRQALDGEDLTVTDARMTRFMMNLETAVALVEHAFENAQQGDLFVHKAPAALISDVARAVTDLVGSSSDMRFIGVRHGEKLHEVLATSAEMQRAEDHGKYLRVPMDSRDLNYEKYMVEGELFEDDIPEFTSENAARMTHAEITDLLLNVPEIARVVAERHTAR